MADIIQSYPRRALGSQDASLWLGLNRGELMAISYILLITSAMWPSIVQGIILDGFLSSVTSTFKVSVIVWFALYVGNKLSLDVTEPVRALDKAAAIFAAIVCALPLGQSTWIVVTGVSLYTLFSAGSSTPQFRSGWVFLSISVPMFWSKRVFNLFSESFLSADASLVSMITYTKRTSNLVAMPGGSGYLQIAAPCSSIANVSLAMLCWVVFVQSNGMKWKPSNLMWCGFACACVIFINVSRIALIGFYPERYDLLHGPVGSAIVSWLITLVVLAICYWGTKGKNVFQV